MFAKNLNADQQAALLALALYLYEQFSREEKSFDEQGFSVIDALFGRKSAQQNLTKLDVLKQQMEKDIKPAVVDITKLNQIFNTHRAKLSLIGTLIWFNGYNTNTKTTEHAYEAYSFKTYVANVEVAKTIYFYSQLLKLNWQQDVSPFYNWYDLQQKADDFAAKIFPIPDAFEKTEIKKG